MSEADPASVGPARGEAATADVAVVVVNYNAGPALSACVRSINESAGDAVVEIVVVDNASADGSLDDALEAWPGTRAVRNDANRGFAAAVNQGIRATTAPYVLLLNPDAEIVGGTLGGLVKVAGDRSSAGAIGVLTRNLDGTVYPSARKVPTLLEAVGHAFLVPFWRRNPLTLRYTMAGWDRRTEREVDWVSGSSMLLRRQALDQVGLLDEGYWMYVEDLDLCTRLRRAGWSVLFSSVLEVAHRVGSVTAGKRRYTLQHSMSVYRYFVKFRSPGWRAVGRPVAWLALRARAALVSWKQGDV
jgi:N-acetylglucosaminyl-diphospho-decaprenol L-rhamnosyltransferase